MQGEVAWKDVLEGDAVERFLKSFVLSAETRRRLMKNYPDDNLETLPSTLAEVRHDVREIWQNQGYLTPAELKNTLIQKYMPAVDPLVRDFVAAIEFSRNQPEAVTGYLSKEHAYLATGLAHLYALETEMPMAMVEVDFSNMGGTNDYFRTLLAKEEGVSPDEVNQRRAEVMTDKAMRLLASSITDLICKEYPEERVIPIRTGGDELRILVTGLGDYADIVEMTNKLHGTIEKHVARMGLQDHIHFKAPDDPVRNGFGAALHIQDMANIENTATIIQELDGMIGANKQLLGLLRLGQVDTEAVEAEAAGKIMSGEMVVLVDEIETIIAQEVARAKENALKVSADLRHMNPVHNLALAGGSAGFHAYVDTAMPQPNAPLFKTAAVPAVLSVDPLGGQNRPVGLPPMASMEDRYMFLSIHHFEEAQVSLQAGHRHLLRLSVKGLMPEDPSAEVLMPQGMVKTIDSISADTKDFKAQFNPNDSDVKQALADAGIKNFEHVMPFGLGVSFHNLAGLNTALGHHNADLVLRYMAQHIIKGALEHAGIPAHENAAAVAHHGGGNFTVLLYPGGVEENGKPWFVSPVLLNKARIEIKQRVAQMNDMGISKFLLKNDVYVAEAMSEYFEREGLKTFANVEDPKTRTYSSGGQGETYRINGMHAVVTTQAMVFDADGNPALSGGAFVGRLRNTADAEMEVMRQQLYMTGKTATATHGSSAVVQDYTMAFNETARLIRHASTKDRGLLPRPEITKERNRFKFHKPPEKK